MVANGLYTQVKYGVSVRAFILVTNKKEDLALHLAIFFSFSCPAQPHKLETLRKRVKTRSLEKKSKKITTGPHFLFHY